MIVLAKYYANVRFRTRTVASLFSFWRANIAIGADTNTCLRFPFTTLSHRLGLRTKIFKKGQKVHGSETSTSSLAHGRPSLYMGGKMTDREFQSLILAVSKRFVPCVRMRSCCNLTAAPVYSTVRVKFFETLTENLCCAINDGITKRIPVLKPLVYRKNPRWQSHKAWTTGSLEQCGYTNREHEVDAKKWSLADEKKAND